MRVRLPHEGADSASKVEAPGSHRVLVTVVHRMDDGATGDIALLQRLSVLQLPVHLLTSPSIRDATTEDWFFPPMDRPSGRDIMYPRLIQNLGLKDADVIV
eukprot:CAMPEP_0181300382 /NCGR_PEP_ID=MMETSP1101-20121128/6859_1 /TAXON_ID=46948 /ORGANISM="Rhodomonas abbreviata, Strain Caron Lab Isolate" /LENGTH=100 /DNA_ID=CAMNT_0023405613 /DNA_START=90 /DNA_END=392 /DNA_ORIENTATION=-